MESISFTKMHGIGNDYIYIYCPDTCPANLDSLAREMSDRHKGVGGDGIILIMPSEIADFKMRIFNSDGSEARMCGNGARCVAKYVYDNNLTDKLTITLETLSGVICLYLKPGENGLIKTVTVDMGMPSLLTKDIPVDSPCDTFIEKTIEINNSLVKITAVSMGNPHAVVFVDNLDVDIAALGNLIEHHTLFPQGVNVEFAVVNSFNDITMRVWERGSGITMACGTGACATLSAAYFTHRTGSSATIHLDGGDLMVSVDEDTGHVFMTGPATTVFKGEYFSQS